MKSPAATGCFDIRAPDNFQNILKNLPQKHSTSILRGLGLDVDARRGGSFTSQKMGRCFPSRVYQGVLSLFEAFRFAVAYRASAAVGYCYCCLRCCCQLRLRRGCHSKKRYRQNQRLPSTDVPVVNLHFPGAYRFAVESRACAAASQCCSCQRYSCQLRRCQRR